ncbi:MAG: hypothetical protein VYE77_08805 [Planctomycetota bacterium]|nr:hypothetical protein [Planctomycetota bacterium]
MRPGSGIAPQRFQLRWLFASPLLLAACLAGVVTTLVLGRAVDALSDAESIRNDMEVAAAMVVAELAAAEYAVSSGSAAEHQLDVGHGIEVHAAAREGAVKRHVSLSATVGQQQFAMQFAVLPGACSPVFGERLTVTHASDLPPSWPVGRRVAPEELPVHDLSDALVVREALLSLQVEHDPGIALLQLLSGTDRRDFVVGSGLGPEASIVVRSSRVVVIEGNLWVERGAWPLRFDLQESLTLFVRGNLYLGRSIETYGPGRLTIATLSEPGASFCDLDGNGRWSPEDRASADGGFAGPIEGVGNVYLGMPRHRARRLIVDAGLVVAGELHLAVDEVAVHGPLVLRHGGTVLPGSVGTLRAEFTDIPDLPRSCVPGFATTGGPRPGPLRAATGQQQSLYPVPVTR